MVALPGKDPSHIFSVERAGDPFFSGSGVSLPVHLPVIDTIFTGSGSFHLYPELDIVSDNFWERDSLIRTGSLDERVEFRRAIRNRVEFR